MRTLTRRQWMAATALTLTSPPWALAQTYPARPIRMLVGFAAGTLAFCMNQPAFVWASAVLIVIGPIVGWILAKAGYGVNGPKYSPKQH